MSHARLLVLATVLFLAAAASAEDRPASLVAEEARQTAEWSAQDANGDGQLAAAEMPAAARPWMLLGDQDGDGALDRGEYIAYLNQPGARFDSPLPDNVALTADIAYAGTDHHRQQLDVFVPVQRIGDAPLPVIAYVHGGGWSLGSRLMARPQVAPHVASGHYAAVSIGYRLSGEVDYPAPFHDLNAGLRWIRANADEWGFDADRVCVMGASAGGHLVGLLGTTNGSPSHAGDLGPTPDESSDVQCAIPIFGSSDLTRPLRETPGVPTSRERFLGGRGEAVADLARHASPLLHVDAEDPPFYFIHGTADPLVPYEESVRLDRALREAGVPTALLTIEGGGHGDFFGEPITRRVRAFLDATLRGIGEAPPSETLAHPIAE